MAMLTPGASETISLENAAVTIGPGSSAKYLPPLFELMQENIHHDSHTYDRSAEGQVDDLRTTLRIEKIESAYVLASSEPAVCS